MHLRLYPSVIKCPPPPPPFCARQSKTDINCNVYNEKYKNCALCLQAGTGGSSWRIPMSRWASVCVCVCVCACVCMFYLSFRSWIVEFASLLWVCHRSPDLKYCTNTSLFCGGGAQRCYQTWWLAADPSPSLNKGHTHLCGTPLILPDWSSSQDCVHMCLQWCLPTCLLVLQHLLGWWWGITTRQSRKWDNHRQDSATVRNSGTIVYRVIT